MYVGIGQIRAVVKDDGRVRRVRLEVDDGDDKIKIPSTAGEQSNPLVKFNPPGER